MLQPGTNVGIGGLESLIAEKNTLVLMSGYPVPYALLIDDDEVNNFICMKNVREMKYAERIEAKLTVEEAIAHLRSLLAQGVDHLPRVIFLDLNLPGASGWTFFDRFKELMGNTTFQTRIFILSSSVYRRELDRAAHIPEVSEYIIKPLSKEVLRDLMSRYPAE